MSFVRANIKRIVMEDVSPRVTQFDVIFEAVTNAIQAEATNIVCTVGSNDNPLEDSEEVIVEKRVDTITISDNGVGFRPDRYDAFCEYRSEKNKDLGCKGVGRLIFLKVFDKIDVISRIKADGEIRSFNFSLDFDPAKATSQKETISENSTEISFSGVTALFLDKSKDLDRRIKLDISTIREKVYLHLLPTLFFSKKRGREVTISFVDAVTSEQIEIRPDDIPDLQTTHFQVRDREEKQFDFNLYYLVRNQAGKFNAYFCADNRTVCDFGEKGLSVSLPAGYSGLMLVESDYLKEKVNNDRNDFDIYPVKTDTFSPLSWEMINRALKMSIGGLVTKLIPDAPALNKKKLDEIQNERPYLVGYIEERDYDIAGFLDKNQIIEKAKKRFDAAKEQLLASAGKDEYTDSELTDAIQITQDELVSYINDRALVLERLRVLADDKEKVEKIIHDLFMKKGTEDDFFLIGKNNLWLIDDRFTTYSYAASDKKIEGILAAIDEDADGSPNLSDKPDLALFFSGDPNSERKLKAVLVEIKPFDFRSKPERKKFEGITQLRDYIRAFKDREKIDEIFAYLVTDVDDKLALLLEEDGYSRLYSQDYPIYHRHYGNLGSIFVVGARTLIADAEARNKVFLDIIRKQSRLTKRFSADSAN